jgi:hypothetical protein
MKRARLVVYPKDIQLITGGETATLNASVRVTKKSLCKQIHHVLT